jgi:hypothetical protein
MNMRRMRQQHPPQQDVTSRLPLNVNDGWYSKVSIQENLKGFG